MTAALSHCEAMYRLVPPTLKGAINHNRPCTSSGRTTSTCNHDNYVLNKCTIVLRVSTILAAASYSNLADVHIEDQEVATHESLARVSRA